MPCIICRLIYFLEKEEKERMMFIFRLLFAVENIILFSVLYYQASKIIKDQKARRRVRQDASKKLELCDDI